MDWYKVRYKKNRLQIILNYCASLPKERGTHCQLWDCKFDAEGYPRVGMTHVHREVLVKKLGRTLKPGYLACHTCDTPSCVNENHLWEGTNADNIRDARDKGRLVLPTVRATGERSGARRHPEKYRGENHGKARLTEQDVRRIRALADQGKKAGALAVQFDVHCNTIHGVLSRRNWSHVA
jgi:hypothetical protein